MGQVNGGPINLASARLRRASLRFATLSGASLDAADLSGADLTDARLDSANLANADLSEALLDHTDFAGARLAGANLCGANLSKARNLTEAQLAEAFGNEATVLPPQLNAPEHWTAPAVEPVRSQVIPAPVDGKAPCRDADRSTGAQRPDEHSVMARRRSASDHLGRQFFLIYQHVTITRANRSAPVTPGCPAQGRG